MSSRAAVFFGVDADRGPATIGKCCCDLSYLVGSCYERMYLNSG